MTFSDEAEWKEHKDPERLKTAQRLFLSYFDRISQHRGGTPEVEAIRNELARDEEVEEVLPEFETICSANARPEWVAANMRVAIKRLKIFMEQRAKANIEEDFAEDSRFGAF